jgi:hypothetical protein
LQVKNALMQQSPGLEVVGSNYPPPAVNTLIARAIGGAQFFVIGSALFGEKLFAGGPVPELVKGVLQNKVNACAAAWFFGNMVHQNLMATGAFEARAAAHAMECLTPFSRCAALLQVFYDGQLVFSKLQSGTRPDLSFIVSEVLRRRSGQAL